MYYLNLVCAQYSNKNITRTHIWSVKMLYAYVIR